MDFKDYFDWDLVEDLGVRLASLSSQFSLSQFTSSIPLNLLDLEMKDRVRAISTTLYEFIPGNYSEKTDCLVSIMKGNNGASTEIRGFPVWVLTDVIQQYGLKDFDISMRAIKEMTKHFTGEFAIRVFLQEYPDSTVAILKKWARSSSTDVRRLVSEGTRPRLPWAEQVPWLRNEPAVILSLLKLLIHDPSEYVRRSVANNLNDISKDHEDLVISTLDKWSEDVDPQNRSNFDWIVRHGCRSLIKKGHSGAMRLQGFDPYIPIEVDEFRTQDNFVIIGNELTVNITIKLCEQYDKVCPVIVDLILVSPSRALKPRKRILKWCRKTLSPGESLSLSKSWKFRSTSTREEQPGDHYLEVLVNGQAMGKCEFEAIE